MSFTDALTRISQIEQQIAQLQTGQVPGSTSSPTTDATGSGDGTASTSFSDALAQASGDSSSVLPTLSGSDADDGATTTATLPSALDSLTGGTGVGSSTGASLPPAASSMLTSDQQQFASQLSADTGLNPGVVSAWLLAEESGGAAQSRQAAGNNDWLNIGYTDSGTYGSGASVWSDPTTAANATAGWLKGQATIPGYGTASSGIQGILSTVGQTPAAQIAALQGSGWASSGYPDLDSLYGQVTS